MSNKYDILDNVEQYTVDELVRYVREGVVTFAELCNNTEGQLEPNIRRQVEERLKNAEDEDWENAKKNNTIEGYQKYLDSYQNGKYREEARNYKNELNSLSAQKLVEDIWNLLNKSSESALRDFCNNYPDSIFCAEAKKIFNQINKEKILGFNIESLINQIKKIRTDKSVNDPLTAAYEIVTFNLDRGKISKHDLLEAINNDNNILKGIIVKKLVDNEYLGYEDLENIGINSGYIQHMLSDEFMENFSSPQPLVKIDRMSTEVYFWGIPSSGKTCTIGAVLSVANNGRIAKTMKKDNKCQGYSYMNRLSQVFKQNNSICTLPGGTPISATYEMGFSLEDQKNLLHPVTLIDLAGELVRCMYKYDAQEPLTAQEIQSLQTLTNILIDNRTRNRKLHFFVIEYGAENMMYEGLDQDIYLSSAVAYIESTGIFKSETDGVYILISKVDKAQVKGDELIKKLQEYIKNHYQGFYNGLERICRTNEINNGKVQIVPFSLGEVCFQDYCQFKEGYAAYVVDLLLNRSKGFKTSKISNIFNSLRK